MPDELIYEDRLLKQNSFSLTGR